MANMAPYGGNQFGVQFPHQGKVVPRRAGSMWPSWQRVFLIGLLLWVASVVVTDLTGNVNLIPTVVLLGSFLVPVTAIIWYLDHYESPTLSPSRIFYAFIVGGVLGILAASLLEAYLIIGGLLAYVGVGLIEEGVKLAALFLVARGLIQFVTRDGIVLGATIGFGFGALESAGYAFNALVVPQGPGVVLSLGNLVQTELVRGILAPVGHGLWTAILGGVLFSASQRSTRLRLFSLSVIGAYLLVSLLHALWDSMRGIALVLTAVLTATPQQQIIIDSGRVPTPSPDQVRVFLVFEWGGLILISIIGLAILWALWNGASREAPPAVMPAPGPYR
jgi:RsiW-degrading membrane proteinase PrsW (M82 family)